MTYRITSPTGEVRTGLTETDVSNFKRAKQKQGIDPKSSGYKVEIESVEKDTKNYGERREYFKNTSPALAEIFPNVAENFMSGKTGVVENIPAAIGDVSSYLPRMAFALSNAVVGNGEGYNLGRRSYDKGTGFIEAIGRSPSLIPGIGTGSIVSKAASRVPKFLGKLYDLGKGVVTGSLFGGADAALNNREPELSDYAVGGALAGGTELGLAGSKAVLNKVKSIISKSFARSEADLDRAIASALKLGNTDRMMTKEEYYDFIMDPKNLRLLQEVKNYITSGRNLSPFVKDRGKVLEPTIESASKKGETALEGQPELENSFSEEIVEGLSPTKERLARQNAALERKKFEPYHDKTIFKPGKHDLKNEAFPTEYPEARVFSNSGTKTDRYQSNLEYNVEKHAEKWDKIGSAVENFKRADKLNAKEKKKNAEESFFKREKPNSKKKTPISEAEESFLKKLEGELERDNKILSKYNAERLIDKNRFLRDVNPFEKNDIYNKDFQKLLKIQGPKGFSDEFIQRVRELTGTARMQGEFAMDRLRSGLKYKNSSAVERAFAYASGDNAEYAVAKNYKNAVDDFADTLSDYADNSIANDWRKNSKNEIYKVEPGRMKKYAFSYLKKVQDVLRKKGALTAKDITGLYGDATMVNDKVVQGAVLKLLRRLGIDKNTIAKFENDAKDYVMLSKAREKLRKNAVDESNPFRGTNYGWLYPQEGTSYKNILFSRLNKETKKAGNKIENSVVGKLDLGAAPRGLIYSGGYRDRKDRR